MSKRPLFVLVLEDETIYSGGDFTNTKWNEIPLNKKIKRIFYSLPNKDCLCLDGYDKYFHMIEATTDLSGKESGRVRIEFAYILGRKEDKITAYKINIKNGNILRTEYDKNDSFICDLNANGWK
jgi:hypothetical protein